MTPGPAPFPDEGSSPAAPGGVEVAPGVRVPEGAIDFRAVRGSGPGGQNVNKVSTKVELRLRVVALALEPWALQRLRTLAGRRLNDEGELVIASDEHRSQSRNRSECLDRLRLLLIEAMNRPKRRVKTRPTRSSKLRRLDEKKSRGSIKKGRSERHD